MKILITGATGFAGSHILRYLSNLYGVENVHGTGRDKYKAKELIAEGYNIHIGDLINEDFVNTQLIGYDIVVHCAAKSSMWGSYNSFFQANVVATQNLLKIVSSHHQLIYISTANMYFDYSNRYNVSEFDVHPDSFTNHYSATKFMAEELVMSISDKSYVTILRPRAIIGVGDTVVFPRLIRAYNEGRLRVVGTGNNSVDFTSVNNLCHAIYLCVEKKDAAKGKVYNITNDDIIVLWDEIKNILSGLGLDTNLKSIPYNLAYMFARYQEITTSENDNEPVMTCYGVAVLNYSVSLSIDKIKNELAYEPKESSKQTLRDFISWYKQASMKA